MKTMSLFIQSLKHFSYELSFKDQVWRIIFPYKKAWEYIIVNKYNDSYYFCSLINEIEPLEWTKGKIQIHKGFGSYNYSTDEDNLSKWNDKILQASKWLIKVKKDWIKANRFVWNNYPLKYRKGIVPHEIVRQSLSDIYRLDKELGSHKVKKFCRLVESSYFHDGITCENLTANDYFNYCKIAYIAGKRKDDCIDANLSGREMYKRYADGRHEGLPDINGDSIEEFSAWLDGKHEKFARGGGHPWEIKRGGNTTHIDLYVTRDRFSNNKFIIALNGPSFSRLKETICMFIAIQEAGLPITITDPEGLRKRLLAQDNMGIVPAYVPLHRANQSFTKDQEVYDVLHYDDLGKAKRQITPFVVWEPLPIIKSV